MMQRSEWTNESDMLGPELNALVNELGIVRDYVDGLGQAQRAPREALFCMMARLGYSVQTERDAARARMDREQKRNRRGLSPVTVAWGGTLDSLSLWSDAQAPRGHWRVRVVLEDGRVLLCGGAEYEQQALPEGMRHGVLHSVPCLLRLPVGYHRLELEWGARRAETMIIAAPLRAPRGPRKSWGLFAPVYALRGRTAQGSGTLSELSDLCELVRKSGGDFVATLPMMAQFLEQPFDSSPFAPASRLFWNEALLDLTLLPELADCAEANHLFHSEAFRRETAALEKSPYVMPGRNIKHVHKLLTPLAQHFFAHDGEQNPRFTSFLAQQPYAEEYARFRAVCDAHGDLYHWPAELKQRALTANDGSQARYQMHLYAQWQTSMQLSTTAERAQARGVHLHLDLPLGVHSASFDMWREPECFVPGIGVGAPRDPLCLEGQDWGFAPAHPEGQRAQGYRYFIAYVRNQLKHAGILRIDHVMGLHRTFCVPQGMSAREGLYLKQPHEELYAIFALEATKSSSVLVGEDLGTVPAQVRETMAEHGLKRMYVLPFELARCERKGGNGHNERHDHHDDPLEHSGIIESTGHAGGATLLRRAPEAALASINTHDMPSFAGLWHAQDIDERLGRGMITPAEAIDAHAERRSLLLTLLDALGLSAHATREDALRAAVTRLIKSDAEMILITLEDLWGEVEPQNVPGTFEPERNFCRRMRLKLEDIPHHAQARALLKALGQTPAVYAAGAEATVA